MASPRHLIHRMRPLALACGLALTLAACGGDDDNDDQPDVASPPPAVATPDRVRLALLGRFQTGQYEVSAAEIPAFDAHSKRAFVVNALRGSVDVLDLLDPANPVHLGEIDAQPIAAGAAVNSVAVQDGIVALAIQAAVKTDPGFVAFYRADTLALLGQVSVGALPDMLTFTPDGQTVLVANEGEPSDDYQIDPEGSISVIDIRDIQAPTVRTADFRAWNGREAALRAQGVRIFGPGANTARDLEPEYIAVAPDGQTAWVTLQENNALAILDVARATIREIVPLGYKDHGQPNQGMDTNDEDRTIDIRPRPGVVGMFQPDAIAAYAAKGSTWLVTANEGDARAWGEDDDAYWAGDASKGFVEEFRVKHLVHSNGFGRRRGDDLPVQLDQLAAGALLNPAVFGDCGARDGNPGDCREDVELGRLNVTWTMGYRQDGNGQPVRFNAAGVEDPNGDRLMYDTLYAFGGRSISIWNAQGARVWDSGDQFERFLASDECQLRSARDLPCKDYFNAAHNKGGSLDDRSDAKGPEPEGVDIGVLGAKTFAFIGLERMGGVLVYDVSEPTAPVRVDYLNTREDWDTPQPGTVLAQAGDLGPEGLKFVPPSQSPTGDALLIVGNEVSGTTAIYKVEQLFD